MTQSNPTVATVGMATIDHLYLVPRWPSADSENRVQEYTSVVGGPAGRSAIAAARLGGNVKLFATCGTDSNADLLCDQIAAENITPTWIRFGQPSQQSAIIVGTEEASRATFWLSQPMADERAIAALPDFFDGVDVALLDSTDELLTRAALDICEARGITTVIDTGSGRPWAGDILPRVDYVICPEKYVAKQLGTTTDEAIMTLARDHCRIAFGVTSGARGGRYVWREGPRVHSWNPAAVLAKDSCGAGDTFHGAFAWAIANSYSMPEALDLAALSAGLKVAQAGNAGIPTLAAIEAARGNIPSTQLPQ